MLWSRRHHTVLKISKDWKVKRTWQFCSQTVVLKSICNGGRSTAPSSSRSVMVMSGYGWLNWTAENSPFYSPFLRKILQQSRAGKEVYFSLLSEFYQIGPVFFFQKGLWLAIHFYLTNPSFHFWNHTFLRVHESLKSANSSPPFN